MGERGRPRHPGILTEAEARVVQLVAKGLTNRDVGERLDITERTVKYHLNQVYSKLGIVSREELIAWQREQRRPSMALLGWLVKPAGVVAASSAVVIAVGLAVMFSGGRGSEPGADSAEPLCSLESILIEAGMEAECMDRAGLETAFGRHIYNGPPGAEVLQAALVRMGDERFAFVRYRYASGELDTLQGNYQVPWARTGDRPFIAGNSLGNFGSVAGQDVLYLCPEYDSSASLQLEAVDSCPGESTLVLAGRHEAVLGSIAVSIFPPQAVVGQPPVPFPTPKGERVQAMIAGVPEYPKAVEIDGFVLPMTAHLPIKHVQVFETDDFQAQVFAYLTKELQLLGWQETNGSHGVSGRSATYLSPEGGMVTVSTAYVPREEDLGAQPPPGFRGKGVPFEERIDGKSRFWIVTWGK